MKLVNILSTWCGPLTPPNSLWAFCRSFMIDTRLEFIPKIFEHRCSDFVGYKLHDFIQLELATNLLLWCLKIFDKTCKLVALKQTLLVPYVYVLLQPLNKPLISALFHLGCSGISIFWSTRQNTYIFCHKCWLFNEEWVLWWLDYRVQCFIQRRVLLRCFILCIFEWAEAITKYPLTAYILTPFLNQF